MDEELNMELELETLSIADSEVAREADEILAEQENTSDDGERFFRQARLDNGLNEVIIERGELPTEGNDRILGSNLADDISALGGNDIVYGDRSLNSIGDDTIDGGDGDDTIFGAGGNDFILGQNGDDALFGDLNPADTDPSEGPFGNDTLDGGLGDDTLNGGIGQDSLIGGEDNDSLNGGSDEDDLAGDSGDDTLYGGKGDDTITGGAGNDLIAGQEGEDLINGGDGNDTIDGDRPERFVGSPAADNIFGDAGDDVIFGGVGSDAIDGGDGDDTINGVDELASSEVDYGRSTIDTLAGGSGADTFALGTGDNLVFYNSGISDNLGTEDYALITDFEFGQDTIDVAGSTENYSVGFAPEDLNDGLAIYYEETEGDRELIAVVELDSFFSSSASTNRAQTSNFASIEGSEEESFASTDSAMLEDSLV